MQSFKEYRLRQKPHYEQLTLEIEEYVIHIIIDTSTLNFITEAKNKGIPLGGQYSAQLHSAHSSVGQQHIHVYAKNNQIFSLNKDGKAHDASHQTHIPNKVAKAIQSKFPEFILPPNNFIESALPSVQDEFKRQLLLS